jgi:RNA polymerase sigma-70 factor, ECF subfamily
VDIQHVGDRHIKGRTLVELGLPQGPSALIDACEASADAAFEEAYLRWRSSLVAWLRGRTRDHAAAEDIAQEAFARLLHQVRVGRAPLNEMAWLRRVALNLVISGARHAKVAHRLTPRPHEEEGDPTAETAVHRERLAELRTALSTLPDAQRDILMLAFGGLSSAQTASRLGISEGAARTRLHRARRLLETRLTAA